MVKIAGARIGPFLRDPGAMRGALLFGPDEGLVRERAEALLRLIAGAADDPFRVSELARETVAEDPALLADAMSALSMTGGRRAVRLREATDALGGAAQAALDAPGEAFLVVEAGDLPKRSALRLLFENAEDAAALGCYPDTGAALARVIGEELRAQGVTAEPPALSYLADRLGADRQLTRRELERLALYTGPGGRVTVADAAASVGDNAGLSLEDALFAAAAGEVAETDRALGLALAEGANPVAVLRAALRHWQRLALAAASVAGGAGRAEAARGARPPVFYQHQEAFERALGLWDEAACAAALERLRETELACKRTGAPDELLARQALLGLAGMAARRGAGRRRG
ncbi:MAG: DNA polymerase III subunit delta [Alphaproteobacteria bacterium]|nr:DNA polymerase III subunit delta [Alphaproteobacteria bacterium]